MIGRWYLGRNVREVREGGRRSRGFVNRSPKTSEVRLGGRLLTGLLKYRLRVSAVREGGRSSIL